MGRVHSEHNGIGEGTRVWEIRTNPERVQLCEEPKDQFTPFLENGAVQAVLFCSVDKPVPAPLH